MEQMVKDLQAQNAQFQQMFLAMAKGQEDLKALLLKDKINLVISSPDSRNTIIKQCVRLM